MKNKIIDEKGRLFGKISIIDIIVIILALILVCAVYSKTHQSKEAVKNESLTKVTYTMELDAVRGGTADAIKAGDKIFNSENSVCIGTITAVDTTEATKVAQTLDGTYVNGIAEGRFDVVMTIEADCRVTNGRIYAQRSEELNVNGEVKACTKYAKFTGIIMEIK